MQSNPLKLDIKLISFLAMLYITISVTADVVSFKFTYFFGLPESGATILFPLTYVLGDAMCEVYGWNIAMRIVWYGIICEIVFAILLTWIIHMSSPDNLWHFQNEYVDVLGNIWSFVLAGAISNLIAGLLNIFFISRWKVLIKGRAFWARSILSTCISEFILVLLTVLFAFTHYIHIRNTLHIFLNAYLLEIIYALIFAYPAQLLVTYLKNSEGIDIYDYSISYNPFKFA